MKAVIGTIDRCLRVVAGLLLIGPGLSGVIGMWGWLRAALKDISPSGSD
jgi:hypothetical protein